VDGKAGVLDLGGQGCGVSVGDIHDFEAFGAGEIDVGGCVAVEVDLVIADLAESSDEPGSNEQVEGVVDGSEGKGWVIRLELIENLPGCGVGRGVDDVVVNIPTLGGVAKPVLFKEGLEFVVLGVGVV